MTENPDPTRENELDAVERALGHTFQDRRLLVRALTHSSSKTLGTEIEDNQTLEFLGDGLLNFLVAELLFDAFPQEGEGTFTKARSLFISRRHFASLGRRLGLGAALRMPPRVGKESARDRDGALADAFEALFAAVYLDRGFEAARAAARRLFHEDVGTLDLANLSLRDPKTALQERAKVKALAEPIYRLLEKSGPDHEPWFVWEVDCGGGLRASGAGRSRKEAQQAAAGALLKRLPAL